MRYSDPLIDISHVPRRLVFEIYAGKSTIACWVSFEAIEHLASSKGSTLTDNEEYIDWTQRYQPELKAIALQKHLRREQVSILIDDIFELARR